MRSDLKLALADRVTHQDLKGALPDMALQEQKLASQI
jgi:hypothetical protein